MICILLGVCPPQDHVWKDLVRKVPSIVLSGEGTLVSVQWMKATAVVVDDDDDDNKGQPTQLLTAMSEAPVDAVVAAAAEALDGVTCELWASAPALLPLPPPGGYKNHIQLSTPPQDDPEKALIQKFPLCIRKWGLFSQPSLLNPKEIQELRSYVEQEIQTTETVLATHHPHIALGKDTFHFREISSRGEERFDMKLQSPAVQIFIKDIVVPRISSQLTTVLGEEVDFDVSVVYSRPLAPHQGWHCDGDHIRGANDAGWDVDGWNTKLAAPYALCLFVPLIDLDDHTGYTQFWPASHRNRDLMGFGPVAEITRAAWDGKCAAGDAIWYDYRLFHRGIANSSQVLRPVVQIVCKKTWYVEKANYGTESITDAKR